MNLLRVHLEPTSMPTDIGIVQNNEYKLGSLADPAPYLLAVTRCCVSQVYYRMVGRDEEGYCSSCTVTIKLPFTTGMNRSSYESLDSSQSHLEDWIAHWTGLDKDNMKVTVTR